MVFQNKTVVTMNLINLWFCAYGLELSGLFYDNGYAHPISIAFPLCDKQRLR